MTGDACIAGDAYPVDAPGLTPVGVHAISTVFTPVFVCLLGITRLDMTLVYYFIICTIQAASMDEVSCLYYA